jgi:plasmid maintenance system killer protein
MLFRDLPFSIQRDALKAYRLWMDNPAHPGLHFKRIFSRTWSVRVNDNYRALGKWDDRGMYWYWIGSHTDYETFVKKR